MTGVSPVTLDDLTSGFNIGWNISTDPEFNRMLGFSEEDVREMLRYYKDAGQLPGLTDVEAIPITMYANSIMNLCWKSIRTDGISI